MQILVLLFFFSTYSTALYATKLQNDPNFSYDVRFTNPICGPYKYQEPVTSENGKDLTETPRNVFCTGKDRYASANRKESPQTKILEWLNDPATQEVFIASLSFSNRAIEEALCELVGRGAKLNLYLDAKKDVEKLYAELKTCANSGNFHGALYGHAGETGWGHNKLIIINPNSKVLKISFASANLSAGVDLHHENWNFLTMSRETYFAQSHLCLIEGMTSHRYSAEKYTRFISDCKENLKLEKEEDIQTFFVPGEGNRAMSMLVSALRESTVVDIAAHRFSAYQIVATLKSKLDENSYDRLRFIGDDDLYWWSHGIQTGPNMRNEYYNVQNLEKMGMKVKFMQTNHFAGSPFLHHNKYMVFHDYAGTGAVFTGAGNFTGDAFTSNFENFYFITIPSVVESFKKQYEYVWRHLATEPDDMPSENVEPVL